MGSKSLGITDYIETNKRKEAINWTAIVLMMIFYGGTWLSPRFYHVTEIYNTSIILVICAILFLNNICWWKELKEKKWDIWLLGIVLAVALVNLFVIGSPKGCYLIIADFLLIFYMGGKIRFTGRQMDALAVFFFLIFGVWFCKDLAFSYNANTGATVTVFSLLAAMIFLTAITGKQEILGLLIVLAMVRTTNLVLWHLARGAFLALALFLFFYYIAPKKWWASKGLYRFLSCFVCLGSLLFVFLYVAMAQTGFNMEMPFFYKSLFSGREKIWMEVFRIFQTMPVTGIGSGYHLESFFEYNMHNVMYDILIVYGIPVFIGSIILIIGRLFAAQKFIAGDRMRICAASGLFAIFLESFIDMDLMWANYSPVLLFLLLVIFSGKGHGCEYEKR